MTTTPISQEMLLERFSLLADIQTPVLVSMFKTTEGDVEVPTRNGLPWRAQIIRVLAPNPELTFEKTDDIAGNVRADKIQRLVHNYPKMFKIGSNITSMTYKTIVDDAYDVSDDYLVFLNNPDTLKDNFNEFGKFFVEKTDTKRELVVKHSEEILAKFKSLMFTLIPKDIVDTIAWNVSFDSATTHSNEGNQQGSMRYGYPNMVYTKVMETGDVSPEDTIKRICPQYMGTVVDVEQVEPENHPVFDPPSPDPTDSSIFTVRVLKKDSAAAENVRELGLYKRMMPARFTPWSWKVLRKNLDITGRAEIWILVNPGENPTQNKELKYKSDTVCEESNEGSFTDETMPGVHFTNHPYGQITLIA